MHAVNCVIDCSAHAAEPPSCIKLWSDSLHINVSKFAYFNYYSGTSKKDSEGVSMKHFVKRPPKYKD